MAVWNLKQPTRNLAEISPTHQITVVFWDGEYVKEKKRDRKKVKKEKGKEYFPSVANAQNNVFSENFIFSGVLLHNCVCLSCVVIGMSYFTFCMANKSKKLCLCWRIYIKNQTWSRKKLYTELTSIILRG